MIRIQPHAIFCATTILLLHTRAAAATKPGPNPGDWQDTDAGIVAQVYVTATGVFRANLFHEFDTGSEPVAVLEGKTLHDRIVFTGNGWSGAITQGRFSGQNGKRSFVMSRVVRDSPTLNAQPPKHAIILFDGTNYDQWAHHQRKQWDIENGAVKWKITEHGSMEVVPGAGSIITRQQFSDFKLHVEFRVLSGKTNGGVYLMTRYEININDSYGDRNSSQCGAFANLVEPLQPAIPMAAPTLQWQTLDVDFRAPRLNGSDKVTEPARATVVHNGVRIHDNVSLGDRKGAAKRLGDAHAGRITLQEHGAAYQFRNIWIVEGNKAER